MDLSSRIENARRNYSIQGLLNTSKKKILCPLPMHIHQSNTPSFSIYWSKGAQHFKCHGNCGASGDVIDLVGYMNISGYRNEDLDLRIRALELLENRLEPTPYIPPEKPVKLDPLLWRKYLPPHVEAIQYAKRRGLNEETIVKFKLGQRGHYLTIPIFEENSLIGIKLRNLTEVGLRFMAAKGSKGGLFNFDMVAYKADPIFVVKGEIPAMLLDQMGYLACAPTGGEGSIFEHSRDVLLQALVFGKLIVIGDNDNAGQLLGKKRADMLGAKLVFPPGLYKDIDEYILAAGSSDAGRLLDSWKEG